MTVVVVDDDDAHDKRTHERGGRVAGEPVDQPYRYREYTVLGPEGELWSFMSPLAYARGQAARRR